MKKLLILIAFPINFLSALEVACNFEEVYQNSEVQKGIFLIKDDMLRYQYYKHNLFTIIAKNNEFFLINNHSKIVQKLSKNTDYLETMIKIISDYPNIEYEYKNNNSLIKIEKSANNFVKRISIKSNELNVSINIMNCKFDKINKKYFKHFNFEEYKGY